MRSVSLSKLHNAQISCRFSSRVILDEGEIQQPTPNKPAPNKTPQIIGHVLGSVSFIGGSLGAIGGFIAASSHVMWTGISVALAGIALEAFMLRPSRNETTEEEAK